jgi:hypothetical protein
MMSDQIAVERCYRADRVCDARGCTDTVEFVVTEVNYTIDSDGGTDNDNGYYCQACVPGQVALRL